MFDAETETLPLKGKLESKQNGSRHARTHMKPEQRDAHIYCLSYLHVTFLSQADRNHQIFTQIGHKRAIT